MPDAKGKLYEWERVANKKGPPWNAPVEKRYNNRYLDAFLDMLFKIKGEPEYLRIMTRADGVEDRMITLVQLEEPELFEKLNNKSIEMVAEEMKLPPDEGDRRWVGQDPEGIPIYRYETGRYLSETKFEDTFTDIERSEGIVEEE